MSGSATGQALFEAPLAHQAPAAGERVELAVAASLPSPAGLGRELVAGSHLPQGRTGLLPTHGLAVPPPPAGAPTGVDRFSAGSSGHGGIELDVLSTLIGVPRAREVYFGNWCRDLSQLIAPMSVDVLGGGAVALNQLLYDLVATLGEAKFGRRATPVELGTYRWEEHADNPREYGIAVDPRTWRQVGRPPGGGRRRLEEEPEPPPQGRASVTAWTDAGDGIPVYLHRARAYALRQLTEALRAGPTRRGRELFGNAMHTVEDFYAHSNFVDLAVVRLTGSDAPMTGVRKDNRAPVLDARGRLRLTTGVFLKHDTVVSLEKLLLGVIEGHPPLPGEPDVGAQLKRILIRRVLGAAALGVYDRALRAWQATGIPAGLDAIYQMSGLPRLREELERQVEKPLRAAVVRMLQPMVEAAARQPVGQATPVVIGGRRFEVIEVSHSQVAKDDPHRPYHRAARELAGHAVRELWQETDRAWRARAPLPATRLPALVTRYTGHPADVGDWWQPIVRRRAGGRSRAAASTRRPPSPTRRPPARARGPARAELPAPVIAGTLRRGSRGPAVRELQGQLNHWLRRAGGNPLPQDGVFGPGTELAVRRFQRSHGLRADGIAGPRTRSALALGPTLAVR
jgi:hypothetical protein